MDTSESHRVNQLESILVLSSSHWKLMSIRDVYGNVRDVGNGNRGVIGDVSANIVNFGATEKELADRLCADLDAAYNSGPRAYSTCFEGTRVNIVEEITRWVDNPSHHRIGWLNGPPGFGKSALTRTLADRWDRSKRLIGSFFFFRKTEQSIAARLIPTLAFNLTTFMPETKPTIEKALHDDPGLLRRKVEVQFQKLIVEPIAASRKQPHTSKLPVIVVDGLDECDNTDLISQLVKAITSTPFSQLPVLFFFTSRIEEDIRKIFHLSTTRRVTYELSLLKFNAGRDIRLFLKAQFESIHDENPRLMGDIPRPWPTSPDLDHIVYLVDGSFVFAATLATYVRGGSPPPTRLIPIVETHTGVDGIYSEILSRFWHKTRFRIVFSTLMLLQTPLSVNGLILLLQLISAEIISDILDIQSIVILPAENSTKVEIVHTSLRDFSTSLKRSRELCVNTAEGHLQLTIYCLQVMSTQALNNNVVVFEEEAAKYASLHWLERLISHLDLQSQVPLTIHYDSLTEHLTHFKSQAFGTWSNTIMWFSGINSHTKGLAAISQKAKVS